MIRAILNLFKPKRLKRSFMDIDWNSELEKLKVRSDPDSSYNLEMQKQSDKEYYEQYKNNRLYQLQRIEEMKAEYGEEIYAWLIPPPLWSGQCGRPNSMPYRAMRMCDIFDLPVIDIAADDCVLFLWATAPLIPEAIYTMKAWGFEYKTIAFTWVKRNTKADSWFWGMGWWTRSNPEYCLLGMKGNPKREAKNVHSIIDTPIEAHSKKPDEVRDKIVLLCGDKPRVELFARQKHTGWDAWGNEVVSDVNLGTSANNGR